MLRCMLTLVCVLSICAVGCGPASSVKMRAVKGQVKLDGKPMPNGEIQFEIPGKVPATIPIKDGAYSGNAPEGKARVEIRAYKPAAPVKMGNEIVNQGSMENYLPARYNSSSTFTADISASGPNEFNFEVTSK